MEKNVKVLASLLNVEEEAVNTALESDALGELVDKFKKDNQIFNLEDFAKLKDNFRREVIENLTEDDIPKEFKNKAVGWKLEALEKELKGEYGYEGNYENLKDLVKNIVEQAKTNKDDSEVLQENQILKEKIVAIEKEKDAAIKSVKEKFDEQLMTHDFTSALNKLGLDYEGDALNKQKELLAMSFQGAYKLKRKGERTVMVDQDGKELVDNKLDPIPLEEGLTAFAKSYGFQLKEGDHGGHGGSSSKDTKGNLAGISWSELLEQRGVKKNTEEADELYKEWSEANRE